MKVNRLFIHPAKISLGITYELLVVREKAMVPKARLTWLVAILSIPISLCSRVRIGYFLDFFRSASSRVHTFFYDVYNKAYNKAIHKNMEKNVSMEFTWLFFGGIQLLLLFHWFVATSYVIILVLLLKVFWGRLKDARLL